MPRARRLAQHLSVCVRVFLFVSCVRTQSPVAVVGYPGGEAARRGSQPVLRRSTRQAGSSFTTRCREASLGTRAPLRLYPIQGVKPGPRASSPARVPLRAVGGDTLSITKGIVSRIALVRYSAAARLLSIQIDAAINPGKWAGCASGV